MFQLIDSDNVPGNITVAVCLGVEALAGDVFMAVLFVVVVGLERQAGRVGSEGGSIIFISVVGSSNH